MDKTWHGQQHDVTVTNLQRSPDVVPFSLKKNRASETPCTERLPHLLPVQHHPPGWGARGVQTASALAATGMAGTWVFILRWWFRKFFSNIKGLSQPSHLQG